MEFDVTMHPQVGSSSLNSTRGNPTISSKSVSITYSLVHSVLVFITLVAMVSIPPFILTFRWCKLKLDSSDISGEQVIRYPVAVHASVPLSFSSASTG